MATEATLWGSVFSQYKFIYFLDYFVSTFSENKKCLYTTVDRKTKKLCKHIKLNHWILSISTINLYDNFCVYLHWIL